MPRLVWLVIELWLWLRWILFSGWHSSWRAVRFYGPDVQRREGISTRQQALRVFSLSLGWCISPADVYSFRLYRDPSRALDWLYEHELPAFHLQRSRALGLEEASLKLIQDKWQLAKQLSADGIACVRDLASLSGDGLAGLSRLLESQDALFCKTRHGSRAEGALSVWQTADGLRGKLLHGDALKDASEVEKALRRLLSADDVLVQPQLRNHRALAQLTTLDDAITVRFITRWEKGSVSALCATLEVPVEYGEQSGLPVYRTIPIDLVSGVLLPYPEDALVTNEQRARQQQFWELAAGSPALPFWDQLREQSCRAQGHFPDIWAIAWDWVITDEGPVLLEGNAGWGVKTPQIVMDRSILETA